MRTGHSNSGGRGNSGLFAQTHWSVVLAAGHGDPARRQEALECLCRTYWQPVYVWLRRSGYGEADAQDLVQGFVAHLLEKDFFSRVSAEKGKFRSFLLKSLRHFLSDEQDRISAMKRGRGSRVVPLDHEVEEGLVRQAATGATPDAAFDHRWALMVLERAFAALEQEFLHRGKADQFRELSAYLECEGGASEYTLTATKLQMTPGAVAVAVHRLRAEYRDCIRHQIAETVNSPTDARDEMNYLLEVLSHIAISA